MSYVRQAPIYWFPRAFFFKTGADSDVDVGVEIIKHFELWKIDTAIHGIVVELRQRRKTSCYVWLVQIGESL